ncbi:hypothetical protein [Sinosporangium siamense]|uniref:hypothetical protein n=1 Tax=Sinosporangium siamense TaxID=1367973 RepID=UPI00195169C0|nr:hypothetical protein [Sinosporangium siamense]
MSEAPTDAVTTRDPLSTIVLPDNTPEQEAFIKECMPRGGPEHSMESKWVREHGKREDFRELVSIGEGHLKLALAGSVKGFVFCSGWDPRQRERPTFSVWGAQPEGRAET